MHVGSAPARCTLAAALESHSPAVASAAREAFTAGLHAGSVVGAIVLVVAAVAMTRQALNSSRGFVTGADSNP